MVSSVFEVKNLDFSYEKDSVINDLNVSFSEGKITTLIGANGCGKSTLLNLMTKNLNEDRGEILLHGENIRAMHLKEFAKKVSIVHQYNTVPPDLTVEKLVSYGRTPYHSFGISKDPEEDERKVKWALEITETMCYKDKPVSELSGGEKQRVWIAMALAQDTKILLLDEPTTYLDISYQIQLLKLIRRLNRDHNITIIMVLHDINQSLHYSDEIVAMKEGHIVNHGCPKEIITPQLIEEIYGIHLDIKLIDGTPFVISV